MSRWWDAMVTESPRLMRALTLALGAAAAIVFVGQLFVIAHFAVDVPLADEWELFRSGALPDGLSLKWLVAPHNEHRIIPTKLLSWLLLEVTHLDFSVSIVVSYLIYGVAVLALLLVLRWAVPKDAFAFAVWFAAFVFSPINHENLNWGFQSQFHLYVLFFVIAVRLLFSEGQTTGTALGGAAFAAVAVYSFTSGVTSALVLAVLYAAFKAMRFLRTKERGELVQLAAVLAIVVAAVGVWIATFHRVEGHGALTPPTTLAFWNHYLNALALGLGATQRSMAIGLVGLLLFAIPAAILLVRERATPGAWALVVLVAALLAAEATISLGRGSFGPAQAKESRYAEYGLLLLPLAAVALAWVLQGKKARLPALLLLWIVCFGSFWKEWTLSDYRSQHERRSRGLTCLHQPRAEGEPVQCTDVYPWNVAEPMQGARKLGASFLKTGG